MGSRLRRQKQDDVLYSPRTLMQHAPLRNPVPTPTTPAPTPLSPEQAFIDYVQNKISATEETKTFYHTAQHLIDWKDQKEPQPFILVAQKINGIHVDCPKGDKPTVTVTAPSFASDTDKMKALKAIEDAFAKDRDRVQSAKSHYNHEALRTFYSVQSDTVALVQETLAHQVWSKDSTRPPSNHRRQRTLKGHI